jgi:hypothetical protein
VNIHIVWGISITPQHVADLLRVLNIPLAAITCGISLAVVTGGETRSRSQLYRFLALTFLCGGLAIGTYGSLGKLPNWWALVPISIGIWLSAAGTLPLLVGKSRSASLKDDAAHPPVLRREENE